MGLSYPLPYLSQISETPPFIHCPELGHLDFVATYLTRVASAGCIAASPGIGLLRACESLVCVIYTSAVVH